MVTPLRGKSSRKGRSHISGRESVSLAAELAMTLQKPMPEEVLGMIQGLASAMQTSFHAQKAPTKQVTDTANSLIKKDLAEAQSKPSVTQGLRLPPVHLLTFKGDPQYILSRYLKHFKSIISTSANTPHVYVAYLKQQCEADVRAFDIICKAEQDHFKDSIPDFMICRTS